MEGQRERLPDNSVAALPGEPQCVFCRRPVFREDDGTLNLEYREYDDTRVCDARGDGANVSTLPHVLAPSIRIGRISREATARLQFDLAGASPRPAPWGGGEYLADRAVVVYLARDKHAGHSMKMAMDVVVLHGHRLKRDGTPGQRKVSEHFRTPFGDDAPAVVLELAVRAGDLMNMGDVYRG